MSLVSNTLKNLFNLLGQKTPKNNGVTSSDLVPLLNSSHAPKGDVSITDLASVLGVGREIQSGDLNTFVSAGNYFCNNTNSLNISNLPYTLSSNGNGFTLAVFDGNIYKFQLLSPNLGPELYFRQRNGGGTWSLWEKIAFASQ